MQQVARETWVAFERRLERAQVPAFVLLRPGKPAPQRPDYHKWTRYYLDFCHKYGHPPRSPTSLGPFLNRNYQAPELLPENRRCLSPLGGEVFRKAKRTARSHFRPAPSRKSASKWTSCAGCMLRTRRPVTLVHFCPGNSKIKTTMIYLQTVPGMTLKEAKSPLDLDPTLG